MIDANIADKEVPNTAASRTEAVLAGRVRLLYALGQQYLFLPFAALCMAAALLRHTAPPWLISLPLVLQFCATFAAGQLKIAYERRGENDSPLYWARRYAV